MKRILLLLALIVPLLHADDEIFSTHPLRGKSFFATRSQSVNVAREAAGLHRHIDRTDTDACYGVFATTLGYQKSTNERRLAEYFFGKERLNISGSFVTNRGANDLLADYFGLPPTFASKVIVRPEVSSVVLDFNYYLGWRDFFARVHAPFVRTRSIMELEETVITCSHAPYPALYMDTPIVEAPARSWSQFMSGNTGAFGHVCEGLCFGKMGCPQHEKKVGDVHIMVGWNPIKREHGHFGINVHFAIPTGTRPDSKYLFEPLVGNSHHWELGGGFIGKKLLWESFGTQTINLYTDVRFTHLFASHQKRSFDLKKNGFGSRYTLLKTFDKDGNYTGKTVPTINRTTLDCDVYVNTQMDALIMIAYQNRNLTFDFGYNMWARTREIIDLNCSIPNQRYGLKGIQNVAIMGGGLSNATQQCATLHGNQFDDQAMLTDIPSPELLNTCDLDLESAASSRALTHKFFAYIGYSWDEDYALAVTPFLGFGAEIEFEGVRPKEVQPNKNSLGQWGLWLKAGFAT